MKETVSGKVKIIIFVVGIIFALIAVLGVLVNSNSTKREQTITETSVEAFEELQGDLSGTTSPYVKFEAYLEKDDKKYDGIRAELNESITLKTALSVVEKGTLKNARLDIKSSNFTVVNNIGESEFIKEVGHDYIVYTEMKPGQNQPINLTLKQNVITDNEFAGKEFDKNKLSKSDNEITFTRYI